MAVESDAVAIVRSDLFERIERLERDCRAMTLPALHEAIDAIRIAAHEHGLYAIEDVARSFERTIARDRQQTAFTLFFDQLKIATDCRPGGRRASDAMLAAISVRLAG